MALSDTQVRQLKAKLEAKHVKTRKSSGTETRAKSEKRKPWHLVKAPRRCAFPLSSRAIAKQGRPRAGRICAIAYGTKQ